MVVSAFSILTANVARAPISRGARLVVAVSGGPDSTALVLACIEVALRPEHEWTLCIAHINHGIRDAESDEDERFVRTFASQHNLEVSVRKEDTVGYARLHGLSREEAARDVRFAALAQIAQEWGAEAVLVGHTADDQAETVLIRLIRGSGTAGLGAMRMRSGIVVRPLLEVRRQTIMDALEERQQRFRIDSSNLDQSLQRNYVRRVVLPEITHVQPQIVAVLNRAARLAQIDGDFLDNEAQACIREVTVHESESAITGSTAIHIALHPAMQRATVRLMVRQVLGHSRDFHAAHAEDMVVAIASRPRIPQMLKRFPGGIELEIGERHFSIYASLSDQVGRHSNPAKSGLLSEGTSVGRVSLHTLPELSRDSAQRLIALSGRFCVLVDPDKLGVEVSIRSRRPGDRMRPVGLNGSKKVQDIMIDRHIPITARDKWPVVESRSRIAWLPGLCLDESVSVSPESVNFALLKFVPAPDNPVLNYGSLFPL